LQEFSSHEINWQGEGSTCPKHKTIQWKGNKIPRELIVLERTFYRADRMKVRPDLSKDEGHIDINIGSKEIPKLIRIGEACSLDEKRDIENLIREYRDVFYWGYDEFKTYKTDGIRHAIPLQEEAESFRQKKAYQP